MLKKESQDLLFALKPHFGFDPEQSALVINPPNSNQEDAALLEELLSELNPLFADEFTQRLILSLAAQMCQFGISYSRHRPDQICKTITWEKNTLINVLGQWLQTQNLFSISLDESFTINPELLQTRFNQLITIITTPPLTESLIGENSIFTILFNNYHSFTVLALATHLLQMMSDYTSSQRQESCERLEVHIDLRWIANTLRKLIVSFMQKGQMNRDLIDLTRNTIDRDVLLGDLTNIESILNNLCRTNDEDRFQMGTQLFNILRLMPVLMIQELIPEQEETPA